MDSQTSKRSQSKDQKKFMVTLGLEYLMHPLKELRNGPGILATQTISKVRK